MGICLCHEAAMAIHFKATIKDFVGLIHVDPTMAEALKIGVQASSRDVSKLSCRAECCRTSGTSG